MPATNKEVRFQFVVDERSAQQAKRVLTDLIGLGQQLARTLQGVNLGGAGGLVGGGGAGGGQTATQMITGAARAPTIVAPQNRSLSQIFLDSGKSIKDLANVSRDSMRVMSDSIKRAVDEQKRSISGLDQDIARLIRRYDDLKTREQAAVSGGHMTAAQAQAHYDSKRSELTGQIMDTQARRGTAGEGLAKLDEQRRQFAIASDPYSHLGGPGDDGGDGGGGGGFFSRMSAGMSGFGRGILARMPGPMASIARMGPAAIAFSGLQGIQNEVFDEPMRFQRMSAQRGGLWNDMLMSTHYGDRTHIGAINDIFSDQEKARDFRNISSGGLSTRIHNFQWSHLLPSNWGAGLTAQSDAALSLTNQQRQVEYIQSQEAATPMQTAMMGQMYQSAGGRLGLMRQVGIGAGYDKNRVYRTGFDSFMQGHRERGWGDSEVAGMVSAIESAGTRKAGWRFAGTALSASAGGIRNAPGIIGAMSEGGLGNASNFMDRLLSITGAESPLNNIGGAVAGMIQRGGYGGDGRNLLDVMAQGLTGGPQDALTARQNIAGIQASESGLMQGGMDPYQSARNTQLGFQRFGDKGLYAAQYASTQITAEELADLRKRKLSPNLSNLGFTNDDIDGLLALQGDKIGSRMDRVINDPLGSGHTKSVANSLKEHISGGGNASDFFKGVGRKDKEDQLSALATGLVSSGQAADFGTAMGMVRTEFGLFDKAPGKGGRKGAAGGGSLELDQVKVQAESAKQFSDWMSKEADQLFAQGSVMKEAREYMTKNIQEISKSAGDLAVVLSALARVASGGVRPENASAYLAASVRASQAQRAAQNASGGGGANKVNAGKAANAALDAMHKLER